MWYEEIYEVANVRAVIAYYKNIPIDIRDELDALLLDNYDKKIFNCDLFDASMLLLANGYLPHDDILSLYHYKKLHMNPYKYYLNQKSSATLKAESLEYVKRRKTHDLVVMVFKDDVIIGTMTLMPFKNRSEMAGMQYMQSDSFESYPDVPGLEIGRLAKGPQKDLLSSAAMTTAFIITEKFFKRVKWLPIELNDLRVCGETFKHVIDGLSLFFPIKTLKTRLNFRVLHHPLGMYFLQRDVLGSLPSVDYLIQLIDYMKKWGNGAGKIKPLIERGIGKSIKEFKPEKYKIHLFTFLYNHPKTVQGFKEMDKMMKEMVK